MMNDKQMIKKIRTTFTGPDYIDNAVQHYKNARKTISLDDAYQSVLKFLNDDVEYFKYFIRDDIKRTYTNDLCRSNGMWRTETTYTLDNEWSIGISKWPDGYEVIIYRPNSQITNSEFGLSFEKARKMVEEWEYETTAT